MAEAQFPAIDKVLFTGFGDGVNWQKFLEDLMAAAEDADGSAILTDLGGDLKNVRAAINAIVAAIGSIETALDTILSADQGPGFTLDPAVVELEKLELEANGD